MRTIEFSNPHRRRHFEMFRQMNHPHFGVCANVEVGPWLAALRARQLRITPGVVYLLSRIANEIPELRQRIRAEQVVEHDRVHPSFSVRTDETDVFSFCEVPFRLDAEAFIRAAEEQSERMRSEPSLEDEDGRDDYLFMSPFPWASFTSVQHAMQLHPHDSVPRIVWGKFFTEGERTLMPLSIQAHHALVDGVHLGRFFQQTEQLAMHPWEVLG